MNKNVERLYNGLIKENPTFVLMLGMCPTLAVTSSAINGLGMGLSTTVVLVLSNMLISAFRKVIPDGVRMPAYARRPESPYGMRKSAYWKVPVPLLWKVPCQVR